MGTPPSPSRRPNDGAGTPREAGAHGRGASVELGLDHPSLRERTGAGVVVAVVDSGIHADHPHVAGVAGGIAIGRNGPTDADWIDRLGHGTAVAAAIREKAPGAELLAVKVFDTKLSSSAGALSHAIDWAAGAGARLVNLSLGTTREEHAELLAGALERARDHGTLVVSAAESGGARWLPGALDGAVGVRLDWDCPRDAVRLVGGPDGHALLAASGYPRPVPGVPPAQNLQGISFAVANVTGVLARALEGADEALDARATLELLRRIVTDA